MKRENGSGKWVGCWENGSTKWVQNILNGCFVRFGLVFQWLEKFPIIGNFAARIFQSLENKRCVFPTIGKVCLPFNDRCLMCRCVVLCLGMCVFITLPESYAASLPITNASYEAGSLLPGWRSWGSPNVSNWRAYNGTYAAYLAYWTASQRNAGIYTDLVYDHLTDGPKVTAKCWVWSDNGGSVFTALTCRVKIECFSDTGGSTFLTAFTNEFTVPGETWTEKTLDAYVPKSTRVVRPVIEAVGMANNGVLEVDYWTVEESMAQARNTSGGASPSEPSTIYLGDVNQVFSNNIWSTMNGAYSQARLWMRNGNSNIYAGTAGNWCGFKNTELTVVTAAQFTATGTWYWGIQADYGTTYGTNFWYASSSSAWADMQRSGTGATLSVTVSALNNPTPGTARTNTANPTTAIDLSWSKNAQNNWVMIVENSADSWTAPTQGTTYTAGDEIGSGRVVYIGDATSTTISSLYSDTTYYYKLYSENYSYYSSGAATMSATTEARSGAKTVYWRNDAVTTNWWDDSNYGWWYQDDASTQPRPDVSGANTTIFDNVNSPIMSVNGAMFPVNQMLFENGTVARTFNAADGGAIEFQGNDAKIENQDADTMTFNVPIKLGAYTQINPNGGDIVLNLAVTNDGYDISSYGNASKMLTVNGVISGGGGFIVDSGDDTSRVKINSACTYTGDTEVDAGELWITAVGSLGATDIYVGHETSTDTAKLWLEVAGASSDEDITVRGPDTWSRYIGGLNDSGEVTYSGDITVNRNVFFDANHASGNGTVVYEGEITTAAGQSVVMTGPGTKKITGVNNYAGDTLIDRGVLAITKSGTLGTSAIDLGSSGWKEMVAKIQLCDTAGGSVLTNNIEVRDSDNNGERRTIESLNTSGTATYLGEIQGNGYQDNLRIYVPSGGTLAFSNRIYGVNIPWFDGDGTIKLAASNFFANGSYQDRGTVYVCNDYGIGGGFTVGKSTDSDYSPIVRIAAGISMQKNISSRPTDGDYVFIETDTGSGDTYLRSLTLQKDEELAHTRTTYVSNQLSSGTFTIGEINLYGSSLDANRILCIDGDLTVTNIANPPATAHKGLVVRKSEGASTTPTLTLNGNIDANVFIDSGNCEWGPNVVLDDDCDEFQIGTTDNTGVGQENVKLTISDAGTYPLNVIIGFKTNDAGVTGTRTIDFTHGSGTVTVNGNIQLSSTDSGGKELVLQNTEDVVFAGSVGASDAGLRKQGTGLLVFTGDATYGGDTYIDNGQLQVGDYGGALGTVYLGETTTGADDAALYVEAGSTYEAPLVIENGTGTRTLGSSDTDGTSPAAIDTDINLANDVIFYAVNPQTVTVNSASGNISGAGNISKTGTGTVSFDAANDYTGTTTIDQGFLRVTDADALGDDPAGSGAGTVVNNSGTLDICNGITLNSDETLTLNGIGYFGWGTLYNSSGGGTFNGDITLTASSRIGVNNSSDTLSLGGDISGAHVLYKVRSGKLTLAGNNSFSGGLGVNQGYVQLEGDADAGGAGTISVASGATLILGANFTWANDITLNGLGVSSGPSIDAIRASTLSGSLTLNGDAHIRRTDNYSGNLQLNGAMTLGANTLYLDCESREILMGTSSSISGSKTTGDGAIYKTGAGLFRLRPEAALTGSIVLNEGTIEQDTGSMNSGGSVTLNDGTTWKSYNTTARTINKAVEITGDITLGHATENGALTFSGATDLNGSTRTITTASDALFSDVLSNGGLVKDGAGTLILAEDNTYASGTTISGGTLQLGNGGASGLVVGNITDNGALAFNRSDEYTYAGIISGSGSVEQKGSSILTLSGNNSHQGLTTVTSGTLKMGSASALGSSDANTVVATGATLDLNGQTDTSGDDLTLFGAGVGSAGALVNNSGSATFNGDITLAGAVTIGGSANSTLSGQISGTTALTKEGVGTILLTGNNAATYTGAGSDISINDGTLKLGNAGALGDTTGDTTANEDSTLDLNGQSIGAEPVLISGEGADGEGALMSTAGAATLSGTVTMLDHSSIGGEGDMALSGVISGGFNLTKLGGGKITLTGANDYTGDTVVDSGVLNIQHNTALGTTAGDTEIYSAAALQVQGGITVGAAEDLIISGSGESSDGVIRNISGNNAFGGAVTLDANSTLGVDAGTLTLGGNINESSGSYALTKVGNGTLVLSGDNAVDGTLTVSAGLVQVGHDDALDSTSAKTIVSATGSAVDLNGHNVGTEPMDIAGTGIGGVGALYNNNVAAAAIGGTITLTDNSTVGGSGDITYGGALSGSDILTKVGAGKHTLTTSSDPGFSGKKVVNGGTLAFTSDDDRLGATPGSPTADEITLNGGTLELATSSNAELDSNNGITLGASGGTLSSEANTFTISSVITGSSGGPFTKAGAGIVALNAANTYDDDTDVDAGTLRILASERIPNDSAMTIAGGAIFDLNDFDETVASLAGGGNVTLGSGTLTAGGDGSSTTYSGVMSESGNFTKTGAGTMTLSGNNTYEGDTTVSVGTLALGAANRIDDASDLIVASGATFDMDGNDEDVNSIASAAADAYITMGAGDLRISGVSSTEFAGVISGSGKLIHEGLGGDEGVLTLSGNNTYEGGTVISGGLIQVSSDANLGTAPDPAANNIWLGAWKSLQFTDSFTVDAGRTLVMDDASGGHLTVDDLKIVTYPGVITGGQLNKNGNGRLQLTGVNTHTNGTHLQYGSLAFGADRNFGVVPGGVDADNICITNVEWSTLIMTNNAVDYDIGITLSANRGIFMGTNALIEVVTNGHLTIAGPISASPNVSMSKEGDGKLTLNQRAGITGILCVNAGELELTAADPLATEWVNVGEDVVTKASPPARLALGPGVTLTNKIAIRTNAVQLTGPRTIAMYPSGAAEITGQIDMYMDFDIGVTPASCTLTNSGLIQSIVGEGVWVNKVWDGTVVFNSALNTFKHLDVYEGIARSGVNQAIWEWCDLNITNTGTYDLDTYDLRIATLNGNGTLDLGSGTITIWNGYDRFFTGKITGSGVFTKSGDLLLADANTMIFLRGNNDFTGGTVIDNGILNIETSTNLGTGGVTFDNAARLWIAEDTVFDSSRGITLTGNGRVGVYTDKTVDFDGVVTGAGGLILDDHGRLTLNGNNNFTGDVNVHTGILRIAHNNALGTVAGDTTIESGAALEIMGGITTPAESLDISGTGVSSGGALRNLSDNNEFAGDVTLQAASTIAVDGGSDTLTLSGVVSDFGTFNITKNGPGTLELTDNNTYAGALYINRGTVEVPSVAAAGNAQPLGQRSDGTPHVYLGSASLEGTLLYTGGDNSTTKNINFPASAVGNINVSSGAATMTFGALSVWSGSGAFHKEGSGTLELSPTDGNNTMTGETTIEAGTLRLVNEQSLGRSPNIDVASGGALELSGDASAYIIGSNVTIRGTGGASGALRAMADCIVTCKVELASDSTIGAGTDGNTDFSITNLIFGAGALTKTGPGRLDLTADTINTYTGTTTISEGAVDIRRDSSLGMPPAEVTPGHLTLDGGEIYKKVSGSGSDYEELDANRGLTIGGGDGTVRVEASLTWTYDGLLHGSGTLTKENAGTLKLGGNSSATYSGDIAVDAGEIYLTGAALDNSAVTVASGAALQGNGSVGALTVTGTLEPTNAILGNATLTCTALDLNGGSTIKIPASSSGTATSGMIMVNGEMTLPNPSEQITVDVSFLGDTTNYFRNIPIIHYSGSTHGTPHTNWVVTGAGALGQFMIVRHEATGSGTYYIQGATPYTDITNGMQNPSDALVVSIQADTVDGLDYDLIYFDAISYPSGTNAATANWQKLYSVTASGDTTTFTNNLNSPNLNAGYLRFLRVSPMGAWQNVSGKFASRQVYVAKKAIMYPGRNWVSLPGVPDNPTVSNVFGYGLPAGDALTGAIVYFYDQGASPIVNTGSVRLASSTSWVWHTNGVGTAADFEIPLDQGFYVDVPGGSAQYLALAGALRTNKQTVTIGGGKTLTFVSIMLPASMHPDDLGLRDCGFTGSYRIQRSDQLYIWDRVNQCIKYNMYMWYNTTSARWEWADWSPVSGTPIAQDDAILLYTQGAQYTWTNNIYYTPPTPNMDP